MSEKARDRDTGFIGKGLGEQTRGYGAQKRAVHGVDKKSVKGRGKRACAVLDGREHALFWGGIAAEGEMKARSLGFNEFGVVAGHDKGLDGAGTKALRKVF